MWRRVRLGNEFIDKEKEECTEDNWNFLCELFNINPNTTENIRIMPESVILIFENEENTNE